MVWHRASTEALPLVFRRTRATLLWCIVGGFMTSRSFAPAVETRAEEQWRRRDERGTTEEEDGVFLRH
jgi:hypothetical protein